MLTKFCDLYMEMVQGHKLNTTVIPYVLRSFIFVDGRTLPFRSFNFLRCTHSCPLCIIQLSLFCGVNFCG